MKLNIILVIVQLLCGVFLVFNNTKMETNAEVVHYILGFMIVSFAGLNIAKIREYYKK